MIPACSPQRRSLTRWACTTTPIRLPPVSYNVRPGLWPRRKVTKPASASAASTISSGGMRAQARRSAASSAPGAGVSGTVTCGTRSGSPGVCAQTPSWRGARGRLDTRCDVVKRPTLEEAHKRDERGCKRCACTSCGCCELARAESVVATTGRLREQQPQQQARIAAHMDTAARPRSLTHSSHTPARLEAQRLACPHTCSTNGVWRCGGVKRTAPPTAPTAAVLLVNARTATMLANLLGTALTLLGLPPLRGPSPWPSAAPSCSVDCTAVVARGDEDSHAALDGLVRASPAAARRSDEASRPAARLGRSRHESREGLPRPSSTALHLGRSTNGPPVGYHARSARGLPLPVVGHRVRHPARRALHLAAIVPLGPVPPTVSRGRPLCAAAARPIWGVQVDRGAHLGSVRPPHRSPRRAAPQPGLSWALAAPGGRAGPPPRAVAPIRCRRGAAVEQSQTGRAP